MSLFGGLLGEIACGSDHSSSAAAAAAAAAATGTGAAMPIRRYAMAEKSGSDSKSSSVSVLEPEPTKPEPPKLDLQLHTVDLPSDLVETVDVSSKVVPTVNFKASFFRTDVMTEVAQINAWVAKQPPVTTRNVFDSDVASKPRIYARLPSESGGGASVERLRTEDIRTVHLQYRLPSESLTQTDLVQLARQTGGYLEIPMDPDILTSNMGDLWPSNPAPGDRRFHIIPLAVRVVDCVNTTSTRMKMTLETPDTRIPVVCAPCGGGGTKKKSKKKEKVREKEKDETKPPQWRKLENEFHCNLSNEVNLAESTPRGPCVVLPPSHLGPLPEDERSVFEFNASPEFCSAHAAQWRQVDLQRLIDEIRTRRSGHGNLVRFRAEDLTYTPKTLADWFVVAHRSEIARASLACGQNPLVGTLQETPDSTVKEPIVEMSEDVLCWVASEMYQRYGPPSCAHNMKVHRLRIEPVAGEWGWNDMERNAKREQDNKQEMPVQISVTLALTFFAFKGTEVVDADSMSPFVAAFHDNNKRIRDHVTHAMPLHSDSVEVARTLLDFVRDSTTEQLMLANTPSKDVPVFVERVMRGVHRRVTGNK